MTFTCTGTPHTHGTTCHGYELSGLHPPGCKQLWCITMNTLVYKLH